MKIFGFEIRRAKNKRQTAEQEWISRLLDHEEHEVTPENAVKVAAAYAAVNVISTQIAMLPFPVYKTTKNGRERDKKHPVYDLLNTQFNEYTSAYDGWRVVMANVLLTEAGYIWIKRSAGVPVELYPINTQRVTKSVNQKTLEPVYDIRFDGEKGSELRRVKYADMIEIKGLSLDCMSTQSPVRLLADVLHLSKAAQDFSKEYFDNGIHPSGVFEMPNHLEEPRRKEFKKELDDVYTGLGRRHKALLLEDGLKFSRIAAPPNEGQMIESRKFQVTEIARFFNIPPHKLMDLERATWANIEEMNITFVNDTLMPWIIAIEQQVNMRLIFPSDRKAGAYAEFNLAGILRGKMKERYDAYATARQWGWMSVNEVREKENLGNIGDEGDIYLTPSNMVNSKDAQGGNGANAPPAQPEKQSGEDPPNKKTGGQNERAA